MTHDEILALSERELDAKVGEALGYRRIDVSSWWFPGHIGGWGYLPVFSSDPYAASEVKAYIKKRGWGYHIEQPSAAAGEDEPPCVYVWGLADDVDYTAIGRPEETALCRAFLLIVEAEKAMKDRGK